MTFQGAGFFDKDLVLECWYDLEVNNGGQYDEEFIDAIAAVTTTNFLPLLGVG